MANWGGHRALCFFLHGGIRWEAAAEASVEELEVLVDGVEGEVVRRARLRLGIEGAAEEGVLEGSDGDLGDLAEVSGHVVELRIGRLSGPIDEAVQEESGGRG